MSRVDVPRLRCDRCDDETEDLLLMASFIQLARHHESGTEVWDLCATCWVEFKFFMEVTSNEHRLQSNS